MVISPKSSFTVENSFSYPGYYKWMCNFFFLTLWRIDLEFWWGFIVSVDCFWQDGHFYYINPANPWAWEIFPSSEIFEFFLQRLEVLVIQKGYQFVWVNFYIWPVCWSCLSAVGILWWRFWGHLSILSYHLQIVIFWLFPFQFVSPWPPPVELLWLGLQVIYWIGREKVGSLV